jgi:hypothetical protein
LILIESNIVGDVTLLIISSTVVNRC